MLLARDRTQNSDALYACAIDSNLILLSLRMSTFVYIVHIS